MNEWCWRRVVFVIVFACSIGLPAPPRAVGGDGAVAGGGARLASDISPLLECASGKRASFQWTFSIQAEIDGGLHQVEGCLRKFSTDSFDLELTHADYAIRLHRRADVTAMLLPRHRAAMVGHGPSDEADHLTPSGITARLLSPDSRLAAYAQILQSVDADSVAILLTGLVNLQWDAARQCWVVGKDASVRFMENGSTIEVRSGATLVRLSLSEVAPPEAIGDQLSGLQVYELGRDELERTLVRGVRRATEILLPGPRLTSPPPVVRTVKHGELRWVGGQRVALLYGSPDQIGKAHGELLSREAMRCIDSVLYTFGTVETVRSGRWFRQELADAYARLSPHIPERHKVETEAMAISLGLEPRLVQQLNVFPELFHCSGFAVFGEATKDGTLYHGRVLDYMTTIGLQDAATTLIVAPDGQHPFANVGYAGFIGSVSGMNAVGISLGEMGGRGEGQWDGVPMATLMRRALEECSTLEEVMALWSNSPRTCEYYYVFADGKTNQAVGVAATPERIEFVRPGETHELLGPGIKDAVVLSAGTRLETLRGRVIDAHGRIDADVAQWLMSRPVAMESNLHNVLFVPAQATLYVANATHDQPAAENPYVRLELPSLLDSIKRAQALAPAEELVPNQLHEPNKTLAPARSKTE